MEDIVTCFIFCGEKSGDLHGSHLVKALKNRFPTCKISGVAGPALREEDMEVIMKMEEFEVMGFSDVLFSLRKIWKQFYFILDVILKRKPQIVVLIDYPGFNLRLAKALRQNGFHGKIVQYIAPTFWAWGFHRANHMVETLDLLLTIYPFEKGAFLDTSLFVEYVGNPVQESVHGHVYRDHWLETLGIGSKEHLIALFPGSRSSEVQRNLPIQLETALLFKKKYQRAIFAISCAHQDIMPTLQKILEVNKFKLHQDIFFVPLLYSYELMRDCKVALAKSGTVTLELALHKKPTVVMYEMSRLNYFIAKYFLRIDLPHYCIANILLNAQVFPEFIRGGASPTALFSSLEEFYLDEEKRKKCIQDCEKIDTLLQGYQTSERAADTICTLLKEHDKCSKIFF